MKEESCYVNEPVHIRHKVGWCPVCGADILDSGYDDDVNKWEHSTVENSHEDLT